MKEATGEVSMTVIVIVAVAVIGGILALMWPTIKQKINDSFGNIENTVNPNTNSNPSSVGEGQ